MSYMKEKKDRGYNGKYVLATIYCLLGEGAAMIVGVDLGYKPESLHRLFNAWRRQKWFNTWRQYQQDDQAARPSARFALLGPNK